MKYIIYVWEALTEENQWGKMLFAYEAEFIPSVGDTLYFNNRTFKVTNRHLSVGRDRGGFNVMENIVHLNVTEVK